MKDFIITTDNTTDLPPAYIEENSLQYAYLHYMMDGEIYNRDNELFTKEFYGKMRAGSMPTTSQVNPDEAKKLFEKCLEQDVDILHIAFSSGLSGTFSSMCIAAEEIMEEHPDCKIVVIDSKCASMGEGLLVHKAFELKKQGKTIDEIKQWINEHLLNIVHIVTVDDLNHLHRGGRVSKSTAVLGTMIGIKPILHINDEGALIAIDKVRGRKKSLLSLVDYMESHMGSYRAENDIVFISHGDAKEDAEFVAELVKERFGIEKFIINPIGATIGAHVGPGVIALFFMGEKR